MLRFSPQTPPTLAFFTTEVEMTDFAVTKTLRFLFLAAILPAICAGQTNAPSGAKPDAATLLSTVAEKYKQVKTYRIEEIEESEYTSELSRQWNKSFMNAAVAPDNRYRFEGHDEHGWSLKVSDGKTEWTLEQASHMYVRKPAPLTGPSQVKGVMPMPQYSLIGAQSLFRNIPEALANVVDPAYLADETITLGERQVPCTVITGRGKYRGGSKDVSSQITVWIDKESHAVRKVHTHMEGALISNDPYQHLVHDSTAIYPVADLSPAAFQESMFTFVPPADAKLVDEFPDPMKARLKELVGTTAPEFKLQAPGGKTVALSELHGKPVLLDFWATWCTPCVDSMPALARIAKEASGPGLVTLSIDENQDPADAAAFWDKHSEPWPNFHDTDWKLQSVFTVDGGIPEFVLIDASGKITLAQTGFHELELRMAIAKLGPEFASISSQPKQ
jgi:thiol-disulfide isomerase/thioredoxin/outer membrane lipoprotein-sorting protein